MGMTPQEARGLVDMYVDANLGVFGRVFPKDAFAILNNGDTVSSAVSALLTAVTFPTLNIVFSAAGKLRERSRKSLKDDIRLQEMEMRVEIAPLDKDGKLIVQGEDEVAPVRVLGIDPFKTKAIRVVETEDGKFITPSADGNKLQFEPDIANVASTLLKAAGGALPIPGAGAVAGGAAALLGAAGPKLGLSFDLFGGADKPKVRLPVVEKSTIASRTEFAWYMRSLDAKTVGEGQTEVLLADGTQFGSAFLQLRRDVAKLRVNMLLATDWKNSIPNLFEEESVTLQVFHPPVPKTPQLTDFSSTSDIRLMVPTREVQEFLGVDEEEVAAMITAGELVAFGKEQAAVTRSSLLKLIGE